MNHIMQVFQSFHEKAAGECCSSDEKYKVLKEATIRLVLKHIPVEEAQKVANEVLKEVIKNIEENRVYGFPRAVYDLNSLNELASDLEKERVTDVDFGWYLNIGPIRIGTIAEINDAIYLSMLEMFRDEGLDESEALHKLRKSIPVFGDKIGKRLKVLNLAEEDENLAQLLQRRVELYIAKCMEQEPMGLLADMESFSTANAFIRNSIRAGKLDYIQSYGYSNPKPIIEQFKTKIKEITDYLFGVKLYNENISLLWDRNMVSLANRHYKDIKQRCEESVARAKELLEEIEEFPDMFEYLLLFQFPAIHGDPWLDEATGRVKILVEVYNELFPERPREKNLTKEERFYLLEKATDRWRNSKSL